MDCWEVPHTVRLKILLAWCLKNQEVDRLLVVHRKFLGAGEKELSYPEALERSRQLFDGQILRETWCRQWPGTVSTRSTALVLVINFTASLIDLMDQAGPTLGDWLERPPSSLPEDLCLFRAGADYPSLVSVTHEKDAWVLTSEPEVAHWAAPSHFQIEELLIPKGDPDFLGEIQSTEPPRTD